MKQTLRLLSSLVLIFGLFATAAPGWAEESAPQAAAEEESAPQAAAEQAEAVNINSATAVELTQLEGIGESKALAIVADRDTNGPFESESDLTRVRGIGDTTVEKNAGRITTR